MKLIFVIFCLSIISVSVVVSFSWQTCGYTADPIKITYLDISSNGTNVLYATGRGKTAINITAPIQGKLKIYKKFFWGWTEMPCVNEVGSCDYEDVCLISPYKNEPCPEEFTTNKIPCKCPIMQGQYAAKKVPLNLNILPQWIEHGRYKLKIILEKDKAELLCLLIYIEL